MKHNTETNIITIYVANIVSFFLFPFLVYKGWTALAPHLNCPLFGYWEVFCLTNGFKWLFGLRGK